MLNNAVKGKEQILFGNDSIVIIKHISDIPGGRTLDCTGYPVKNVFAGSVIIKTVAEGKATYKPMPLVADGFEDDGKTPKYKYGTLPEGATYEGVLYRSISVNDPQASIMFDGVVNEACLPYELSTIASDFKQAVPHIIFKKDEVA